MKKYLLITVLALLALSCKLQPDSDRSYDKDKVYKLRLMPASGSVYKYELTNETKMSIEAEGKEAETLNSSSVELLNSVATDSSGDYMFTTTYDQIRIYTKNGDTETNMDADNAMVTIDPVERMLGILKSASLTARVNPKGEVKIVSGYKELEEKLLASFDPGDHYGKTMAKAQWEKTVGERMVKNTMEQLFKIFPDSAIHVRDTWKIDSRQEGELPMNIKNIYTLKAINDDVTIISSEGIMTSDKQVNSVMGYNGVSAQLEGKQEGEFQIETKTGILLNSRITAGIDGKLLVMGREVPVSIKSSIKMTQKKAKN